MKVWNRNSLSKNLASLLSLLLFLSNTIFANTIENNFWADRMLKSINQPDRSNLIKSLPSIGSQTTKLAHPTSRSKARNNEPSNHLSPLIQSIAPRFGSVRTVSSQKSDQTIIHIHDVHMNEDAQKNISLAIQTLLNRKLIDLVAVEAAFDDVDLSGFHKFEHQNVVKQTADHFLQTQEFQGPLHASLVAEYSVPVVGIDSKRHYEANVEAYRQSSKLKIQKSNEIQNAKAELKKQKRTELNPDLLTFDTQVQAYREGKLPIGNYVKTLIRHPGEGPPSPRLRRTSRDPALTQFTEAVTLESSLNLKKVESQRTTIINILMNKMTSTDVTNLLNKSMAYSAGEIRHSDFYNHIKKLCQNHGVNLSDYKSMDSYIHYLTLADSIDADRLFDEIEKLENQIYASLIQSPKEKDLLEASRRLYLTEKLINFSLTPKEWENYKSFVGAGLRARPNLEVSARLGGHGGPPLRSFEEFYQQAEYRDKAMAKNVMRAMKNNKAKTVLLVTGGFHSKGIREAVQSAKCNVQSQNLQHSELCTMHFAPNIITFIPKIEKIKTTNGSSYLNIFTQEKTPLEKIFKGDKLFLSPRFFPEAKRVRFAAAISLLASSLGLMTNIPSHFKQMLPQDTVTAKSAQFDNKKGSLTVINEQTGKRADIHTTFQESRVVEAKDSSSPMLFLLATLVSVTALISFLIFSDSQLLVHQILPMATVILALLTGLDFLLTVIVKSIGLKNPEASLEETINSVLGPKNPIREVIRLAKPGELAWYEAGRRVGYQIIIHPAFANNPNILRHELAHLLFDPTHAPPQKLKKFIYYTIGFLIREGRANLAGFGLLPLKNINQFATNLSEEQKKMFVGTMVLTRHSKTPLQTILLNDIPENALKDNESISYSLTKRKLTVQPDDPNPDETVNELYRKQIKAPGNKGQNYFGFWNNGLEIFYTHLPNSPEQRILFTFNSFRARRPGAPNVAKKKDEPKKKLTPQKPSACILCKDTVIEKFPNEMWVELSPKINLYLNPFPVYPPKKGEPAENQPMHIVAAWADGHRPQKELMETDVLREYRQQLMRLNQSLSYETDGPLQQLDSAANHLLKKITAKGDSFNIFGYEPDSNENKWRLGFNGAKYSDDPDRHGGASQDHIHSHFVRQPFEIENAPVTWDQRASSQFKGVRVGILNQIPGPKAEEDALNIVLESEREDGQKFRYLITGRKLLKSASLDDTAYGYPQTVGRQGLMEVEEAYRRLKADKSEAVNIFRKSILDTAFNRREIETAVKDFFENDMQSHSPKALLYLTLIFTVVWLSMAFGFHIGVGIIGLVIPAKLAIHWWPASQKQQVNQTLKSKPPVLLGLKTFDQASVSQAMVQQGQVEDRDLTVAIITESLFRELHKQGKSEVKAFIETLYESHQTEEGEFKGEIILVVEPQIYPTLLKQSREVSPQIQIRQADPSLIRAKNQLWLTHLEGVIDPRHLQNASQVRLVLPPGLIPLKKGLTPGSKLNNVMLVLLEKIKGILKAKGIESKNLHKIDQIRRQWLRDA